MVTGAGDQIPAEERVFCLLIALMPLKYGLSKAEIFADVRGYREEFRENGATEALNKKFDRDKDELRSLGIPLRTTDPENPADTMYYIPESEYTFEFTPAEVSLLTAASAVWAESAHALEAREIRIRLLSADAGDSELDVYAPRIETHDPAYVPVSEALVKGYDIAFPYLKPGESTPMMRNVSPLALQEVQGRWHFLAWDHQREAERTFLLRRIVGKVQQLRGEQRATPSATQSEDFIAHLNDLWDSLTAQIRVKPHSKASHDLGKRRDTAVAGDIYTVHYLDEAVLADELCQYGADALVLEPASLRDAVIARLEKLVTDHA